MIQMIVGGIVTNKMRIDTQSEIQVDRIRNLYAILKWKGEKFWNM